MSKRQSGNIIAFLVAALVIFGVYWLIGILQLPISPLVTWVIIFGILGLVEWLLSKYNVI
jgi:hypothetical protein